MDNNFDTIVAIITPPSVGAVGIIRLSGSKCYEIVSSMFSKIIKPKMINYGFILDDNKNKIDEVILLPFLAPHSYTGEDVIEIQTHGSFAILNEILNITLKKGARLAARGEFTKRAFLNHRIDLSQAEAVLDVIQSKSLKSAQNALATLGGYLKNEVSNLKEELVEIYSKVIASIDFPEDVAEVDPSVVASKISKIIEKIENILSDADSHNYIKDGLNVCLIGVPNVGKSSLFNALLNYTRAIVTPIEGTTRDTIKETLNLGGYLINFIDTAGIRDKNQADLVEQIGIDNSLDAINQSEIVLFLFENSISEIDKKLIELAQDKKYLFIKTKCDIKGDIKEDASIDFIEISSKTGFGIDILKEKIIEIIRTLIPNDTNFTVNTRQKDCLIKSKISLEKIIETSENMPLYDLADLFALDLKQAILALDEISGVVLTDNILDNIFDNFCIGK